MLVSSQYIPNCRAITDSTLKILNKEEQKSKNITLTHESQDLPALGCHNSVLDRELFKLSKVAERLVLSIKKD